MSDLFPSDDWKEVVDFGNDQVFLFRGIPAPDPAVMQFLDGITDVADHMTSMVGFDSARPGEDKTVLIMQKHRTKSGEIEFYFDIETVLQPLNLGALRA